MGGQLEGLKSGWNQFPEAAINWMVSNQNGGTVLGVRSSGSSCLQYDAPGTHGVIFLAFSQLLLVAEKF